MPCRRDDIVDFALQGLCLPYADMPDPEGIIADSDSTLAHSLESHVAVLDTDWQIETFGRYMIPQLQNTGRRATGGVGRPAALYRHSL